jgi:1-hydroxycarotenoid 3,4-desaturase
MAPHEQVIVVGAGIGGMSCAIDLARAGLTVTVVERSATAGGKMREVAVGPCCIDAGPTVLTMRWVFDQIFEDAGATLGDHVRLRPLSILARHAWDGSGRLDLFADIDRTAEAIGEFAGLAEAAGYRAFCADARRIFESLRDSFLGAQQTGPLGLARRMGPAGAGALLRLRAFETLWGVLGERFRDPRLRQLFGRYATYCGSSPFEAPATLMLVAHVEQEGVWLVEGGMQRIADALQSLAQSLGVVFRFSAHVETVDVSRGQVAGVTLACGERLAARDVVVNADPAAIATGAFGPDVAAGAPAARRARSLSAVTWAMRAQTQGFPLTRHNVFFSDDYRAEFEDIFRGCQLPRSPTIYVCAQDRDDSGLGSPGFERLLILVNAPAAGDCKPLSEQEISACEARVFGRLRRCGLEVTPETGMCVTTTPTAWNAMFPASGGALYGQATHGWRAAFDRPGARTKTPGLYLAGGGAHPGPGAPMAALSGRLAASALTLDRASTPRWRPVVIPGGMSTR